MIIFISVTVDLTKSFYLETPDSFQNNFFHGFEESQKIGIDEFKERWKNLSISFTIMFGGYSISSVFAVLLFLWTISSNYKNNSDRFFLSMLFISLLPILFGDYIIQSRMFFNIPFQILISLFLYKILKNPKITFGRNIVIVVMIFQLNFALRAMANMGFVSPGG